MQKPALKETSFVTETVSVVGFEEGERGEVADGVPSPAAVSLQMGVPFTEVMLLEQLKTLFDPDTAIALGKSLQEEGERVKGGHRPDLVIAQPSEVEQVAQHATKIIPLQHRPKSA